jgi:hypothetical protein
MVDNSPSMAPKVSKLNAQFPKLIDALKDPTDGTLPDLRVAIIDSDLGTGGAVQLGSCGPKILSDGTTSVYGDLGRFQMFNPTACGVTNINALCLEYLEGKPVNYTGDIKHRLRLSDQQPWHAWAAAKSTNCRPSSLRWLPAGWGNDKQQHDVAP